EEGGVAVEADLSLVAETLGLDGGAGGRQVEAGQRLLAGGVLGLLELAPRLRREQVAGRRGVPVGEGLVEVLGDRLGNGARSSAGGEPDRRRQEPGRRGPRSAGPICGRPPWPGHRLPSPSPWPA